MFKYHLLFESYESLRFCLFFYKIILKLITKYVNICKSNLYFSINENQSIFTAKNVFLILYRYNVVFSI